MAARSEANQRKKETIDQLSELVEGSVEEINEILCDKMTGDTEKLRLMLATWAKTTIRIQGASASAQVAGIKT